MNTVRGWLRRVLVTILCSGTAASGAFGQAAEPIPDSLVAAIVDVPAEQVLEDALDALAPDRPGLASWTLTATRRGDGAPRFRTRIDLATRTLTARIDAEQDPSEPWLLRPADGRWGFDHAGAFAAWRPSDHWEILFGDYRLSHALGLVAAPPRLGRAVDDAFGASRTGRNGTDSPAARPYAGSDEDRYHSGLAITREWKSMRATVFRSRRSLDAETDSVRLDDGSWRPTARLRPAQDHATPLGASRRRGLRLGSVGAVAAISGPGFDVSALVLAEETDRDLVPGGRVASDPFRTRISGSVSARATRGRYSWSGEVGQVDRSPAWATYLRFRNRTVSILAGARRYSPQFAPLWASALSFRSGVPGNERGLTVAVQWRPDSGGPFRVAVDRGCRIRAENGYARAGCRNSARIDGRWSTAAWTLDGVITRDLLREPDTAVQHGMDGERSTFSAVATRQAARSVNVIVSASVRHVKSAETGYMARSEAPERWSSRMAMRVRWNATPRLVVQAGLADFHVTESVLGVYRPGLPLMSSIGMLSGDGTALFLTMARTGSWLDWGATMRSTRSRPTGREGPPRVQNELEFGFHVRISWPGGSANRT